MVTLRIRLALSGLMVYSHSHEMGTGRRTRLWGELGLPKQMRASTYCMTRDVDQLILMISDCSSLAGTLVLYPSPDVFVLSIAGMTSKQGVLFRSSIIVRVRVSCNRFVWQYVCD